VSARAERLVASLDPAQLAGERWFAEKGRRIAGVTLVDAVEAGAGVLALVEVAFVHGEPQRYAVPDGTPLWWPLLDMLSRGARGGFAIPGTGSLSWIHYPPEGSSPRLERVLGRDQSNSSFVLGEQLVVKCYRRLQPGAHPEVELVTALTEAGVAVVPAARGAVIWDGDGACWSVALVQDYVPEAEDGWAWAQAELQEWIAGARDLGWAAELGRLTGELHAALAVFDRPGLRATRAAGRDLVSWRTRAERQLEATMRLEPSVRPLRASVRAELAALAGPGETPLLTRVHGDLHVGQVLRSPAGYHVVDFEGEPTRPLAERRRVDSPLRDVASMLRSFDNTARWALRDTSSTAADWVQGARVEFLRAYAAAVAGTGIVVDPDLLRVFEVEKAVYEVAYAARVLREWMPVALGALNGLFEP
jgi:maltokinase